MILKHSSKPVCGFSMMEQVRLCVVWLTETLAWIFHYPHTQMGREVLEGLHVLPKPAAPIIQENKQTDHCPFSYKVE